MENIDIVSLPDSFYEWIAAHTSDDPARLRLAWRGREPWIDFAVTQVECRRKCARKLPVEIAYSRFLFPTELSAQQSTSDTLARFHASLVGDGACVVDMTAGLGIDAMHVAGRAARVTAVDIDPVKTEALAHNAEVAGIGNVTAVTADCRDYLDGLADGSVDTLFVDPARRADDGSRLFSLAQCQPDVLSMLPQMRRVARRLVVKMSPMLDVTQTLRDLPMTTDLYVLGAAGECKELTAVCDLTVDSVGKPVIHILDSAIECQLSFTLKEEAEAATDIEFSAPKAGEWLYEPSAPAMKAAPWGVLCRRFGLRRLHPNTNLYVSPECVDGFPGTRWHVDDVLPFSSGVAKRFSRSVPQVNVAVRNFPMSADSLRRKLKVKDMADDSRKLIGTTVKGGEQMLLLLSKS